MDFPPPHCPPPQGGGGGGYLPTAGKAAYLCVYVRRQAKSSDSGVYMLYMSISGFFANLGDTVAIPPPGGGGGGGGDFLMRILTQPHGGEVHYYGVL